MPHPVPVTVGARDRRRQVLAASAALLSAAGAILSGCQYVPVSGGAMMPTSSTSGAAPTPDPFGGVLQTGDEATPGPAPEPTNRPTELVNLSVGGEDYVDLDWNVSCSGIENQSLSIIATANDGEHNYTVVLLGADEQLSSFTFTSGRKGQGIKSKSGLTVTPGSNQGSGSLRVDDRTVTSNGGGVAYGPDIGTSATTSSAKTPYEVEVYCGK